MSGADRTVVVPDGTAVEVRKCPLPIWPMWCALWLHDGHLHGGPWIDDVFVPWDHDPTDAEVLSWYESWTKTMLEQR